MNWLLCKKTANIGEIYIYGEIASSEMWGDEVTPSNIKNELDKVKGADSINLYVNSPGGGVFAGVAIFNEIKRFNKPATAYIDGVAASIASLIVLAADKVVMPSNAMLMIHNPYNCVCADAAGFRAAAERLDKLRDSVLIDTYNKKTGIKAEELKEMLDAETWLSGQEAVDLGFADELDEEQKIAACYTGEGKNVKFNDVEVQIDKFRAFPKSKFTEHKPKTEMSIKQRCAHEIFVRAAKI